MLALAFELRATNHLSAPEGLRQNVLAELDFKPVSLPRRAWSRVILTSPATWVSAVIILGVIMIVPWALRDEQQAIRYRRAPKKIETSTSLPGAVSKSSQSLPQVTHTPIARKSISVKPQVRFGDKAAEQFIKRNANITMEVDDIQAAKNDIAAISKSARGKFADNTLKIVVTIPSDALDNTMKRLSQLGTIKSAKADNTDNSKRKPENETVTININLMQKNR
jgi:hypothetical protein